MVIQTFINTFSALEHKLVVLEVLIFVVNKTFEGRASCMRYGNVHTVVQFVRSPVFDVIGLALVYSSVCNFNYGWLVAEVLTVHE